MAVSSGLQRYFDSQRQKKWDIRKKLEVLKRNINPAFVKSFEDFHDRILAVVDDGWAQEIHIVEQELANVDTKLKHVKWKHTLKKASSVIDIAEK